MNKKQKKHDRLKKTGKNIHNHKIKKRSFSQSNIKLKSDFDEIISFQNRMEKEYYENIQLINQSKFTPEEIQEYKESSLDLFQQYYTPIETCMWIIYPFEYLKYQKEFGNKNSISSSLRQLSNFSQDHEDLYSFEFPIINTESEVFPFLQDMREIRRKLLIDINKKLSSELENLMEVSSSLIDELTNIINDKSRKEQIKGKDINSQSKVFYRIAFEMFSDVIEYQTLINKQHIDEVYTYLFS